MTTAPALDLVLPADRAAIVDPDPDEATLSELYRHDDGVVRASMISTLDGAVAGPDGRSGSINGPPDHRVFTLLRALCDVVLVGAGTARTEGYGAPRTPERLVHGRRRRGQPDHPQIAVVTHGGDLGQDLLGADPWVFTTDRSPRLGELRRSVRVDRLHVHEGEVDLALVLRALARAGLTRVVTEGGPALLGGLLDRGLVDELCLSTSPVVVGGPGPLAPGGPRAPVPARLAHLLHGQGFLLARWTLDHPDRCGLPEETDRPDQAATVAGN